MHTSGSNRTIIFRVHKKYLDHHTDILILTYAMDISFVMEAHASCQKLEFLTVYVELTFSYKFQN